MTFSFRFLRRCMGLTAALSAFFVVTGCHREPIAAVVNSENITQEEYLNRLQSVRQFTGQPGLDIGGATLVGMVREKLTAQLAAQKGFTLPDAALKKLTDFLIEQSPQQRTALAQGAVSREDIERATRQQLQAFAIGTDGAKAEDKDLQATLTQRKEQITIPETWAIRILQAPSESAGLEALGRLKVTADFKAEARKFGANAQQSQQAGAVAYANAEQLKQGNSPLYAALTPINPGQFAPAPIAITVPGDPNQGVPPHTEYIVAQVVEKHPRREPSLEEIRPLLTEITLAPKYPQLEQHQNQALSEFTKNAKIEINIERYKDLASKFIIPIAESYAANAPGGTLGGPAPSPGVSPQSAPAPSGAAPPAGSTGSTAPSSAPTGNLAPAPSAGAAPGGGKTSPAPKK